ncbi:MAG: CapA family protein [Eubacterium sp.]|nr:CapA family protein [Eubacterium sp.]
MKKSIQRAFLKSALIVCILLVCVLSASVIRLALFDGQESSQTAANPEGTAQSSAPGADAAFAPLDNAGQASASGADAAFDTGKSSLSDNSSTAEDADTTLVFAGDVYFSDYVLAAYQQSGIQGVLGTSLRKELKRADLAIVNNEFPYSTRGTPAPDKQFTFRVDPAYVSLLTESGVDVVTLANNHVLDYGTEALADTFQTLKNAGIAYVGAGNSLKRAEKLITKKANGHTFGFLAASRVFPDVSWNVENQAPGVLSAYDPSRLLAAVKAARSKCDFLCVYVHWGIERNTTPEPYQTDMAHALIDAGADAVIGAHPHVLQGVEMYQGKPIFYSLGNFIFYQTIAQTAVAKLTVSSDHTVSWQLIPAQAANACTTLITEPAARQQFYDAMAQLSANVRFSKKGVLKPVADTQ